MQVFIKTYETTVTVTTLQSKNCGTVKKFTFNFAKYIRHILKRTKAHCTHFCGKENVITRNYAK